MSTDLLQSIPTTPRRSIAIEARDVSKTFRIPTQRVETLKERVVASRSGSGWRTLRALDQVSFDVAQGESLGIVGRNGSGKSTLLKLMASIYRADSGSIRVAGLLVPFIELGVGFNPELPARDNVVLNGVMMGLSPREARRRFDHVLEFAELEDFAELKLKNYSSGMLVRLGFSLMTQVDADILLVDEVLAVGDAAFQQKCFDTFSDLHAAGKTIVLITHDMAAVNRHCDRALLLEAGAIEAEGDTGDVTRRYLELNFEHRAALRGVEDVHVGGRAGARFTSVEINGASADAAASLEQGERIQMRAEAEILHDLFDHTIGFQIVRDDNYMVFAENAPVAERHLRTGDRLTLEATIENPLAAGHYYVNCGVGNPETGELAAFRKNAADFVVFGSEEFGGMVKLEATIQSTHSGSSQ